jgi:hypothetical protein
MLRTTVIWRSPPGDENAYVVCPNLPPVCP